MKRSCSQRNAFGHYPVPHCEVPFARTIGWRINDERPILWIFRTVILATETFWKPNVSVVRHPLLTARVAPPNLPPASQQHLTSDYAETVRLTKPFWKPSRLAPPIFPVIAFVPCDTFALLCQRLSQSFSTAWRYFARRYDLVYRNSCSNFVLALGSI